MNDDKALILKRKAAREKMRRYRKRIISRTDELKQTIEELEAELIKMIQVKKGACMLPWSEIADILKEESQASTSTKRSLEQEFCKQRDLLLAMRTWVDKLIGFGSLRSNPNLHVPPSSRVGWRQVSLLSNPLARKAGMDWITQNLYMNTDRVFESCMFPPITSPEIIDDFLVDSSSQNCLKYLWRDQRDINAPFGQVCQVFNMEIFHTQMTTGARMIPRNNSTLSQDSHDAVVLADFGGSMSYTHHLDRRQRVNHFLFREFRTENRYACVSQIIHNDDSVDEVCAPRRNRMDWFVLDRLPGGRTKLRILCLSSQHVSREGPVSLEAEAASWGVDLTECKDAEYYTFLSRHIAVSCSPVLSLINSALDNQVAKVEDAYRIKRVPCKEIDG